MKCRFLAVTSICALSLLEPNTIYGQLQTTSQPPTAPTTTKPGEDTGKKIGTMVSSAIDTAFPMIGKILDLFKGNPNKKNASKDEVTKATDDAQKQFLTTVKQKLQPAATVAKELAVLQAFATAAVNANDNILTINLLLNADAPDYDQVDTEWGIAKNYLADVITIKSTDIDVVSDPIIKLRLLDLQNSRRDLMVRIDKNVALGKAHKPLRKADLQTQMTAMASLLKGLNSLAAIELSSLQADIDGLAKWANGAAGGASTKEPNANLLKIANTAVTASKEAVSSTQVPQ